MTKIKRFFYKLWLVSIYCRSDRKINKCAKILEKYYASK